MVDEKTRPLVLTIAGSDPTGGAGVHADLEAIRRIGGDGVYAITAITAQDEDGVLTIHPTPTDVLSQQLAAAVRKRQPDAIKIGMVATLSNAKLISWFLRRFKDEPVVVDPVFRSSSGYPLLERDAMVYFRQNLLPLASVVTPNRIEAEILAGQQIKSVKTMETAAEVIYQEMKSLRGKRPFAVVIKGGHMDGDDVVDVLYDGEGWRYFSGRRIAGLPPRGTGCRFASVLATALAGGETLIKAVEIAKEYLVDYIKSSTTANIAGWR